MQFDKHIYLHKAAEEALKPCLACMARVRTFAHKHQVIHRLRVYMPTYGSSRHIIPAGMYASQASATAYLQQGTEMDNCIQKF
eukprot:400649-Pelagomonas_calceolata.AAC.1